MTYPADALFDIETLVNVAQPSSILLLGDHDADFLAEYLEQKKLIQQSCEITQISIDELDTSNQYSQPFDVGIGLNLFEHLSKQRGERLLCELRDVLTRQYCICLPITCPDQAQTWKLNELFGFALERVSEHSFNGQVYGVFKYSIEDYKKTPDWLNAKNWANPSMWGKYWW